MYLEKKHAWFLNQRGAVLLQQNTHSVTRYCVEDGVQIGLQYIVYHDFCTSGKVYVYHHHKMKKSRASPQIVFIAQEDFLAPR